MKEVKRLEPTRSTSRSSTRSTAKAVTDEKAFRERVAEDLDGHFDRDAEWVFRRRFVVDLLEKIDVKLPTPS